MKMKRSEHDKNLFYVPNTPSSFKIIKIALQILQQQYVIAEEYENATEDERDQYDEWAWPQCEKLGYPEPICEGTCYYCSGKAFDVWKESAAMDEEEVQKTKVNDYFKRKGL